MKAYLSLLGHKVKDRVTGTEGIVDSVAFDLYGCVQCSVHAGFSPDGTQVKSYWFDWKRLEIIDEPVMEAPKFEAGPGNENGPAYKAILSR